MNNVIELFNGSPRLSNNILPRKQYSKATVTNLKHALEKREIEQAVKKAGSLDLDDLAVFRGAMQLSPEFLRMMRGLDHDTIN